MYYLSAAVNQLYDERVKHARKKGRRKIESDEFRVYYENPKLKKWQGREVKSHHI